MKKTKTHQLPATCYLLILPLTLFSQNWQWSQPRPTGNEIREMIFIDADLGWMVGDAGTVLKTTDGGLHWETITPVVDDIDSDTRYQDVQFVDAQKGWIAGQVNDSTVLAGTQDGGDTWSVLFESEAPFFDLHFIDAQNGLIVTGAYFDAGVVWRTEDGGQTWSNVAEFNKALTQLFFIDELNGWGAFHNGGLLAQTQDGGYTWTLYSDVPGIRSVFFLDEQYGWGWTYEKLYHTNNGGQNWIQIYNEEFLSVTEVLFEDPFNGIMASFLGVYATTDGGYTWEEIEDHHIAYRNWERIEEHIWTNSYDNQLRYSTDGGANWDTLFNPLQENNVTLLSAEFIDQNHGWVVGGQGTLYYTPDGGENWGQKLSGSTTDFFCTFFIDEQNGWISGRDGLIWHTIDGGQTWQVQSSGTSKSLWRLWFRNAQEGWAVGEEIILKTEDGGQTWIPSYETTDGEWILDIAFRDLQQGWAAGSRKLLRTQDGGATWTEVELGIPNWYFTAIELTGTQGIWLTDACCQGTDANFGNLFYSPDDGGTWDLILDYHPYLLEDVEFTDSLHGWVVGGKEAWWNDSHVLYTEDGGLTWEEQDLPYLGIIYDVEVAADGKVWVVGPGLGGGAILYANGSPVTANNETWATELDLMIFPNPSTGMVRLALPPDLYQYEVLDLQGRNLTSGLLGKGAMEIDLSKLPSGLYLLRVRSEKAQFTGKVRIQK